MGILKFAAAFSERKTALTTASTHPGHLFESTSGETSHLPFAALYLGETDDLTGLIQTADLGVYLVAERTIKNQPLSDLSEEMLPGCIGIFPMVANPVLGRESADRHWRIQHAPLALEVHSRMTHYYQLSVVHRFTGSDWHGLALCCFADETDLRHRFFDSVEGERLIAEDVARFADTRRSPRRVIASVTGTGWIKDR